MLAKAADAEASDVVLDQGQRDDERHEAPAILLDRLDQLGALRGFEIALEGAGHVLEDIDAARPLPRVRQHAATRRPSRA